MIYAGILAAGRGWDQKENDLPRQFMMLGNKPIIIHSIEQFVINYKIDKIIIAVNKDWVNYTEDIVEKYLDVDKEIIVVEGGENKYLSLINIGRYLMDNYVIEHDDVCIYHDAIRPFLTQRLINENIEGIKKYSAVSTVIPTVDTIISSNDGKKVDNIPIKNCLYAEQTPQTFKIQELLKLNKKIGDDNVINGVKTFIDNNYEVKMVIGEYSNLKIVTQYELEVANALIKGDKDDK